MRTRLSRADLLRAIAPSALLVGVAALGVRNHLDHDQSSWEGASLGMFATYDNDVSRVVAVTVDKDNEVVRVSLPDDLRDDARRLAVAPSADAAQRLATAVLARTDADVRAATVQLWKLVADDGHGLELRYEPGVKGRARR